MAGLSFTIGTSTFSAISATAAGRYAMTFYMASPDQEIFRFHPPGIDGNYLVRGKRTGQKFFFSVRYVDTVANAYGKFETDFAAWANTAVSIVSPSTVTYTLCNLVPGTFRITGGPVATGRTATHVYLDADAIFTRDG